MLMREVRNFRIFEITREWGLQQRHNQQRNDDDLDHGVDRRPGGVLVGIAHGVAGDGGMAPGCWPLCLLVCFHVRPAEEAYRLWSPGYAETEGVYLP